MRPLVTGALQLLYRIFLSLSPVIPKCKKKMEEREKKRTIRDEMKMDDTMKWFRDGSLSVCGLRKETKEVLLNKDSARGGHAKKVE